MEYVDEKLQKFNIDTKKNCEETLDEIADFNEKIYGKIEKMNTIDNRKIILNVALSLHDDMEKVKILSSRLVDVKRHLGIINIDEHKELKESIYKADDEKLFWSMLCSQERKLYQELIDNTFFKPFEGSWNHCDCKGMYDMTVQEIGKLVKKDLQELYPDIRWSVKTEKAMFRMDDTIRVGFIKIPKKYIKYNEYDKRVNEDVMKNLFDYRKYEVGERCRMYYDYAWIKDEQVIDDDEI